MSRLQGKIAVVTGGVSGIGRATSLALAREGASVVANYSKSENDAKTTLAMLEEIGGRHMAIKADASDESEVLSMRDQVLGAYGRVDILVNNAGMTAYVSFMDTDVETWDRLMAVNLRSPFICTKHFGKVMLDQGGGAIVNISSRSAFVPEGSSVPYVVSKAGVMMLTRCAAGALAPTVRVNSVGPGFIATPWYTKYGFDVEEESRQVAAKTPLKRAGKPEDIASAVVFLVSDEASFITGQTLLVEGGRTMH